MPRRWLDEVEPYDPETIEAPEMIDEPRGSTGERKLKGRLVDGRYRVVRRLGSGGMGSVWLAQDERLDRQVALKRMHQDLDDGLAERFGREARLGASLNHENVVKVFDVFQEEEEPVTTLVLEYVSGGTLAALIRRGALPAASALEVLRPVAEALDHAHQNGVVHRDIKPANVLIGDDGSVKLADLGVATSADLTRVTSTGTALGSAAYMAPEQLAGDQAGPASDIYSLATVAFEVLTGRKARTGESPMAIVHQVANHPPPDLTEVWPDAPPGAAAVLKRGMADVPDDRPASASELVLDLERELRPLLAEEASAADPTPAFAAEDSGVEQPPAPADEDSGAERPPAPAQTPRGGGRRRRWIGVLAGTALVAALVAVVVALSRNEETTPPRKSPEARAEPRKPAGPAPDDVVRSFYTLAADDRFAASWKLAGPGLRRQLGGFDAFKRQLGTLESVDFAKVRAAPVSGDRATVSIVTRAVHTNKVDNCSGDVFLDKAGRSWVIARLGVTCS